MKVRKTVKISLLASLALHLGSLCFAFYLSLDFSEFNERTHKHLTVSIISVSEFDAQISEAPRLPVQKVEIKSYQNFYEQNRENFEIQFVPETDLDFMKDDFAVSESAFKDIEYLRKTEPTFFYHTVKGIQASDSMNYRDTNELEHVGFFDLLKVPKKFVPKKVNVETTSFQISEQSLPRLDHVVNKSEVGSRNRSSSSMQALQDPIPIISSPAIEQMNLSDLVYPIISETDFEFAKKDFKMFEPVSKPFKYLRTTEPTFVNNTSKHIKASEGMNHEETNGVENIDFSNVSKTLKKVVPNKAKMDAKSFQISEKFLSGFDTVIRRPEVKAKKVTSSSMNALEEPISSSWGSAIEQKILSNLVYPKKAQKKLLSGKVFLKLEVFSDGTIGRVLIRRSSGHLILDRAAQDAVLRSLKLPAAPDNYPNKRFIFNLPVKFSV